MIIGIFAVDEQGGLGRNGLMPWHDKNDMQWFKNNTTDNIVVMGRKTWESTGYLPNRRNIVITNQPFVHSHATSLCNNVCANIVALQQNNIEKNVFVIGGANILVQAKPILELLYITKIPGDYSCDVRLNITEFTNGFNLIERKNLGSCEVEIYDRVL